MTDRWAILRCANRLTLQLAESLNDAGFEAWTPAESAPKNAKGKVVSIALTPSFVFAAADRLQDLLALSHSPTLNYQVWDSEQRRMVTKGHPYFRLFRDMGKIALVTSAQLDPLRMIERRRKPRGIVKPIAPGTAVRMTEGGFAGMTGSVGVMHGKHAMVAFDRFPVPVKVPLWMLREALDEQEAVNVNRRASEQTARAA